MTYRFASSMTRLIFPAETALFLVVLGVLLLVGVVAVICHSRNFRGSGEHFASEERPDVSLSKGLPRNDGLGL